ncbi:MAG: TusE/DsrC/DsvC family sulfur relay protein [Acidiferrobacterales bacterium]
MQISILGKTVETNVQGFLLEKSDWNEEFASEIARRDGVDLYTDHWELIWYFRDYFDQNQKNPTMHKMVRSLGKFKGDHFHDQKKYEKHIYSLFPTDPIHELCKLAGLPMPPPDT